MSRFFNTYYTIINETNFFGKISESMCQFIVDKLNKNNSVKIYLKELFQSKYLNQIPPNRRLDIQRLHFNSNAFLTVQYSNSNLYGQYIPPMVFSDLRLINTITTDVKQHTKYFKYLDLTSEQKGIEYINSKFNQIKDFGCIQISLNNNQYDIIDVVEHELQHFIFLLCTISRTNIMYGLHFSNNKNTYNLNEDEFITLLGSYNNYLIKHFSNHFNININNVKLYLNNLLQFFKTNNCDLKYLNLFKSDDIINKDIKSFYLEIYSDERFTKINKWKLLLKWTYLNFCKNLSL